MSKLHKLSGPAILQLNVEGLTQPKCKVIQKIAMNNSIAVILLQETHATNDDKITIYGYSFIGSINHPKHGIATPVVTTCLLLKLATVELIVRFNS